MSRFKHNLSHYKQTTMDMGKLVPIGCMEVLPGDTFQHSTSLLLRVSPLVAPVMHPVTVRVHHFFVPHRIVWQDFERFITGGANDDVPPTFPTITVNNAAVGSLADYFDVPSAVASDRSISALPFRGYATIYNEYYRDEDLTTALTVDKTDGVDSTTNTTLQSIAWEKDRFTSARPWAQKGTAVSLPLGTTAPIRGKSSQNDTKVYSTTGATKRALEIEDTVGDIVAWNYGSPGQGALRWSTDSSEIGLEAVLSSATAATINDIRWAFAIQKYKEARAQFGHRYTEYLAYLGVRSSDARLQRPEYLGGGKATISFSEVLQQSVSTSGTPGTGVGILKGHGIAALRSNRYRRFFEEHGYVISLLSVRPKSIYGNGIPKHLLRSSKEDFWQKELQHVGQAEIYNQEVYSGDSGPTDVFGYQDRYDEYRREESRISAGMRSSDYNTWNLARIFAGDVTLNNSFVTCDPAESRIFQSTSADTLQVMAYHSVGARRLVAPTGWTAQI